jgi:alkylation response protein AidB-like acyl-CoA dehydrogenase
MYSFEPSEEQKMLIDVVNRYATSDLRPSAREADESCELPLRLIEKGWELGMLQASIPEEFGGFGEYSAVTGVLAVENLAYGDLAGALAVMTPGLFTLPIFLVGSEEQKERFLPAIVEAEWKPYTAALLEQSFDFDPRSLKATAAPEGDTFVLNGEKSYVPFASQADHILVYADLDGQTQGFLIKTDTPGLTLGDRQKLLGLNALPLYSLSLESVRVPEVDRLGGPGGHPFDPILTANWLANASLAIGISNAAFEYSRDYAKDREVFGVKVAQKQAIAFMLAEMATEIEAIRLLTWEAAWMADQKIPESFKQAYLASIGAADLAMMVTDRAVQILGGHGYIREHPVEMWLRDGRSFSNLIGLGIL